MNARERAGDMKAAHDTADYPNEWSCEQRTGAYWMAVRHGFPAHTSGWYSLAELAARRHERITSIVARERQETLL